MLKALSNAHGVLVRVPLVPVHEVLTPTLVVDSGRPHQMPPFVVSSDYGEPTFSACSWISRR
ncbi:hypothetical protein J6590_080334 [Homalodisca vitripennis]|nr:hypothetical protein J6590_080334 [Homalodisca vitripennis]